MTTAAAPPLLGTVRHSSAQLKTVHNLSDRVASRSTAAERAEGGDFACCAVRLYVQSHANLFNYSAEIQIRVAHFSKTLARYQWYSAKQHSETTQCRKQAILLP